MIPVGAIQGISIIIFKSLWETKDEAYKLLSQRLSHAIFYASEEYKENFVLRHGFIRQEEFRPSVSLEDIYVNPHFTDQATFLERSQKIMLPYEEINYLVNLNSVCDGLELSQKYSHLVIKGEQGIGKTTFLKKIGLSALDDRDSLRMMKRHIPVFIQISQQLNEDINIKSMISQEFQACGFPEHEEFVESALRKGRLLILIDGLDAAPPELQDQLLLRIKDFSDSYAMNRFIVTCRTFRKTQALSRFHEALILGFDHQRIQEYIRKSIKGKSPDLKDEKRISKYLISECKATKYVIHNPFALSIALSLYQRSENRILGQTFLYDKILSRLISNDESVKVSPCHTQNFENSFSLRLKVLAEMAYLCFKSGRSKFHKMEIYRLCSAIFERHSMLRDLTHIERFKEESLFDIIVVSGDVCQFKNPMIQKILIAYHLMESIKLQNDVIEKYFHESAWKDVFIFLAGIQGTDYLIDAVQPHLSRYLCTARLSSFMHLTAQLAAKVTLSSDRTINYCHVNFMILDIVFLFGHRQYEQKLIAKVLRKIRKIIELIGPESKLLSSSEHPSSYRGVLGDQYLIDPRIVRGLSIDRLFDLALVLASKNKDYGLIEDQECQALMSTISRLKKQLKNKSMSSYHRRVCENNLYKLWLKALKINDQDLNFTVDELQAIFLYYQSVCLIFYCMKEAFYISGRMSREVSEIFLSPQLTANCPVAHP
ncbi:NACHT domain-containing protein [Leptolyngbya sp. BL0902]|uniref:NACHT domain-containing protein n=1 Tax=Leptolyngbya sp. BL0902 TaxID=1115757 RepID=UPI0018E7D48D|nr:NACHT domain-containing protein [Leptolyngbya sp. BL0902]QQE64056.1 NACHT domain-containing protein [Leptolyngbya sp. BL0902]